MCGAIPSASPEVVIVANNLGYRPPGSEENTTASGEPGWPRLGSFEVSVTLYDTRTGQRWGPITLFSKIASYKVRLNSAAPRAHLARDPAWFGWHARICLLLIRAGAVACAVSRDRQVDGAGARSAYRVARLAAAAQPTSAVGASQNTGS